MEDQRIYALALKYLQRRPRSEREISDYLTKKKASEESIHTVLGILRKQKFVNDEEFALWWIDQRTRFKPKGKHLITLELQQKGISKEITDQVYKENGDEIVSDVEKASAFLQKKKSKFDNMSQQERYNKAGALLARRGFDYETIRKALKKIIL